MALTLLTQDWCGAHGIPLTTLTVDHGLRAESAKEARVVAEWMQQRGIAHRILTPAPLPINNRQARARAMRYGALTHWCRDHHATHLLVAHHADDQAETLALQRHRGQDGPSRSGMALVSKHGGIPLLRPLLGVRKAALITYLQQRDQPWIDDPSNESDAYARNRLRRTLDDSTIERLWHDAQRAGQQRHAQDRARNRWLAEHARETPHGVGLNLPAWRMLNPPMRADILSRAIHAVGGKPYRPRRHETDRLVEHLLQSPPGKATLGLCAVMWDATRITIHPESSSPRREEAGGEETLVTPPNTPYIAASSPLKQLASEPFWWFNYPLL